MVLEETRSFLATLGEKVCTTKLSSLIRPTTNALAGLFELDSFFFKYIGF